MRVSEIQCSITTSLNKCCKPRKANESTSLNTNNSLERTPVTDAVSFGRFGGEYASISRRYALRQMLSNPNGFLVLDDSIYLSIEPTEETVVNPSNGVYEANLVDYREFRPEAPEENVEQVNRTMQGRVEDFNNIYGYESGWEKHLSTTEDFEKAAELANYLDNHGLFPSDDSHDPMSDMSKWCYDHLV